MRNSPRFTVEKQRVLVPVGEPCPFGCRYCYTRGGEVGVSHLNVEDILVPFHQFAHTTAFETIQFGYDSDPFARPERGLRMLKQLAKLHKHVNFSTKAALDSTTLAGLADIQAFMDTLGTTLSALVSLSCWESAPFVEPHTPSPAARIMTAIDLKRISIPVFISVRPILPHVPDSEYERIVDEGIYAGCEGFILGPLYDDAKGKFARFVPSAALADVPGQTKKVPWSAHAPTWTRYEDTTRLQRFLEMIEQKGGRSFVSSADAVSLVQQKEYVA